MLNIMLNGMAVLNTYKEGVASFFLGVIAFGFLIAKHIARDEIDVSMRLPISLSLGSITLCLISYVLILLAHFWPSLLRPGGFAILFFAVFVLLKGFWSGELRITHDIRFLLAGIALFLLLIVRLSFLKYIILPPYSDSPIHYQIVFGFLHPEASNSSKLSLENIFGNYYHFGFHSLAAWLTSITAFPPANTISLLGQIFLVIAPASVLFLTYVITQNSNGALYAGLLAAIGWSMPAFAINWGKFPALSALSTAPAAIAILGLYLRGSSKKPVMLFWGLALVTGIALMHTRITICVLLVAVSFFLSKQIHLGEELGLFQSVRLSLLYVLSLLPLSQLIIGFYSGFPVLVIMLILLPFAFQAYPRLCVGIFFYTFGLWLVTLAPTFLIENSRTLLDRQFVEIMLYIPFSVIGGAGFAGLIKKLPPTGFLRWFVVAFLVGGVLVNFPTGDSIFPDPCCDYFKKSDQRAIRWIEANTSGHTLVLISTFEDSGQIMGTDAGIWIYPLTRRDTNKLPFNTDWDSLDVIGKICHLGAQEIYIYMGGREYSFMNSQLAHENWAKPVFVDGKTVVYQVSECSQKLSP